MYSTDRATLPQEAPNKQPGSRRQLEAVRIKKTATYLSGLSYVIRKLQCLLHFCARANLVKVAAHKALCVKLQKGFDSLHILAKVPYKVVSIEEQSP